MASQSTFNDINVGPSPHHMHLSLVIQRSMIRSTYHTSPIRAVHFVVHDLQYHWLCLVPHLSPLHCTTCSFMSLIPPATISVLCNPTPRASFDRVGWAPHALLQNCHVNIWLVRDKARVTGSGSFMPHNCVEIHAPKRITHLDIVPHQCCYKN